MKIISLTMLSAWFAASAGAQGSPDQVPPAQPVISAPAQPSTAKPAMPSTAKPAMPSTAKPAMPSTAKPAMPSTAKPAMPSDAKSALPMVPPPGQVMTAPTQPVTPVPQPVTPVPGPTFFYPSFNPGAEQPVSTGTAPAFFRPVHKPYPALIAPSDMDSGFPPIPSAGKDAAGETPAPAPVKTEIIIIHDTPGEKSADSVAALKKQYAGEIKALKESLKNRPAAEIRKAVKSREAEQEKTIKALRDALKADKKQQEETGTKPAVITSPPIRNAAE